MIKSPIFKFAFVPWKKEPGLNTIFSLIGRSPLQFLIYILDYKIFAYHLQYIWMSWSFIGTQFPKESYVLDIFKRNTKFQKIIYFPTTFVQDEEQFFYLKLDFLEKYKATEMEAKEVIQVLPLFSI